MQIDWLKTFLTAAEEQNFRKTAQQLHLSQPTVTQHIHRLEELWQIQLFHRVGQHVELSSAGRRFLPHAKQLMADYTQSLEDISRWRQGYTHRITVAVSPLVATTYLPRWIKAYTRDNERIEFAIKVMESSDIPNAIQEHSANLGLTRARCNNLSVQQKVLYEDKVILVAPALSQNIDGTAPDAQELLTRYPVLTHCHPEYWPRLLENLQNIEPSLRTLVVSQVHVVIDWIAQDMGISFLPRSAVLKELLRGTVEEVPFSFFPLPTAQTRLLIDSQATPAVGHFAEFMQQYMTVRQI